MQFFENGGPQLRNASGTEREDHVARLSLRRNGLGHFGERRSIAHILARDFLDAGSEGFAGDALDGLLAGGVDVENAVVNSSMSSFVRV